MLASVVSFLPPAGGLGVGLVRAAALGEVAAPLFDGLAALFEQVDASRDGGVVVPESQLGDLVRDAVLAHVRPVTAAPPMRHTGQT